jgi:hypothetical protein
MRDFEIGLACSFILDSRKAENMKMLPEPQRGANGRHMIFQFFDVVIL